MGERSLKIDEYERKKEEYEYMDKEWTKRHFERKQQMKHNI